MAARVDSRRRAIGVNFTDEKAHVRVWAPKSKSVDIRFDGRILLLEQQDFGYWTLVSEEIREGTSYHFVVDGKDSYPDPASLFQPEGVHGPSQAIDVSRFQWTDEQWKNLSLRDYIFYELHTGTFTPQGDLSSIIDKIPYLKSLGITAIELMPIAQFPGARNWGYDGVFPFAVQSTYGGPHALQTLVDACHQAGIAVVLDVVYNHLGPEGNYLEAYGPYFTDKYKTPWGKALNFDDAGCDAVRDYFIENVLMWFRDFHVDALRLDAVHAIKDFSPDHILKDIREAVNALESFTGRTHHLITELDLNDPRFIDNIESGGYGMNAQWVDEFHHALRVTTGQPAVGYYEDFNGLEHLAKAYRDAYVYDGQYSAHRGKHFGKSANRHRGDKFVVFSQNHDQVGNRMLGERTSALISHDLLKVLAGATILSPYLPLLFMGEEYGEKNPFLYFIHHSDPALIEAVRKGRADEFKAFQHHAQLPDPQSEDTFQQCKLTFPSDAKQTELLEFYKKLIALRKDNEALRNGDRNNLEVSIVNDQVLILHRWTLGTNFRMIMNFGDRGETIALSSVGEVVLASKTITFDKDGKLEIPGTSFSVLKSNG